MSRWALLILIQDDSAQGNVLGGYIIIYLTGSYAGPAFEVKRNWKQATDDQRFASSSIALQLPITDYMIDDAARSQLEMALFTEPLGKSLEVSAFDFRLQFTQLGMIVISTI
jgi:hypothetical protein